MALSDIPCVNRDHGAKCGGFITTTELKMARVSPEFTAQHYHDVLELFEDCFDLAYEEDHGGTE